MERNLDEQRNINALFVADVMNGGNLDMDWIHMTAIDSDYENLTDRERLIVDTLTEREKEMASQGKWWNEDDTVDYESAVTALVDMFECSWHKNDDDPGNFVRWCDHCGMPMDEGYIIRDSEYYACSVKCRNGIYVNKFGCKDDKEARLMYRSESNGGEGDSFYTEWH